MAQVYDFKAPPKFDKYSVARHGMRALQHYRDYVLPSQPRSQSASSTVPDAVLYAYVAALAPDDDVRDVLKLTPGALTNHLVDARRSISSNCDMDLSDGRPHRECAAELRPAQRQTREDCALVYTTSESELAQRIYTIASPHDCHVSDLQYSSRRTLVDMVEDADAYDARETSAAGLPVQQDEDKPDLSHIPVTAAIALAELEQTPTETAPETDEDVAVTTHTISIGDVVVPLLPVDDIPILRADKSDLHATGLSLESDDEDIRELQTTHAVLVALDVAHHIADVCTIHDLSSTTDTLTLMTVICKHRMHTLEMRTDVRARVDKDTAIFTHLEMTSTLRHRRTHQILKKDSRGTSRCRRRDTLSTTRVHIPETIITHIATDHQQSRIDECVSVPGLKCAPSTQMPTTSLSHHSLQRPVDDLILHTIHSCTQDRTVIELLATRGVTLTCAAPTLVDLTHMTGTMSTSDMPRDDLVDSLSSTSITQSSRARTDWSICSADSARIVHIASTSGLVRARLDGYLVDARDISSLRDLLDIDDYSRTRMTCIQDHSSLDDLSQSTNDPRMHLCVNAHPIFAQDEMPADNSSSTTVCGAIFRTHSGVYTNPALMLRRPARYASALDCASEAYECPMCAMQCTYLESSYSDRDLCEYTYTVPPSDTGLPAPVPIEPLDYVASSSISESMTESWIVGASEQIIIETDSRTPPRVVRPDKSGLRSHNLKSNLLEQTSTQWSITAILAADTDLTMSDVHTVHSRASPPILLTHMSVRDLDDDMSQHMRDLLMSDTAPTVFSTHADTTVAALTHACSALVITTQSLTSDDSDKLDRVTDLCVIHARRTSDARLDTASVTTTRDELADIDSYSLDLTWAQSQEALIDHLADSPEQLIKTCRTPSALCSYAQTAHFYTYVDHSVSTHPSLVDLAVTSEYVAHHLGLIETVHDTCIESVHLMEESIMAAGLHHPDDLSRVRALITTHSPSVRESHRYDLLDRVVHTQTHLCADDVIMRELIRHTHTDSSPSRERLSLTYGPTPARLHDLQRHRDDACPDTCPLSPSLMSRVRSETLHDRACTVVTVTPRRVHDATDPVIRSTSSSCRALVTACASPCCDSTVNRIFTAVISLLISTSISTLYPLLTSVSTYDTQTTHTLEDGQIELQATQQDALVLTWCALLTLSMSLSNSDRALASTPAIATLTTSYAVLASDIVQSHSADEHPLRSVHSDVDAPGHAHSADIHTLTECSEHCMTYTLTTPEPPPSAPLSPLTRGAARDLAELLRPHETTDMRLSAAVRSGHSPHLPSESMTSAALLICVPPRVLATASHDSSMPLFAHDVSSAYSARVRPATHPITIMTYGYALTHFHHNPNASKPSEYIVMHEIHTSPTDMSPLSSLIRDLSPHKTIIKTSATHVAHHVQLPTTHTVDIDTLPLSSPKQCADMQAPGVHADAPVRGTIISVSVGCYTQLDDCSEALRSKRSPVLQVDARTLSTHTDVHKMVDDLDADHTSIVPTHIIENAVTLDVHTVVDLADRVSPVSDSAGRSIILHKTRISMAERQHRSARVGRLTPGVAYTSGNAQLPDSLTRTVGATHSALIRLAYGVQPVVDDVDVHCIANVTKTQASAASMSDLTRLSTVHHIDTHASIPRPVSEQVTTSVSTTDAIAVCENYMAAHTSDCHPLHSYIRSTSDTDHVSSVRLPCSCPDMSQDLIVTIAEPVQLATPKSSCPYAIDTVDLHVVAHTISVAEHTIEQAKSLVTEILNTVKRWRDTLVYRLSTPRTNSLMASMVGCIPQKIDKTRELLDTRIRRLDMSLVHLDTVSVPSDHDALMRSFSHTPHPAEYLHSHSTVDYLEQTVLHIHQRTVDCRVIGALSLVTPTVARALYRYLSSTRVDEHIELHASNTLRSTSDTRPARSVSDADDQDMLETLGIEYSDDVIHKTMTTRHTQRAASHSGWTIGTVHRVTRVFHQSYGVNPLESDTVYMTVRDLMRTECSTNDKWTVEDLIVDMHDDSGVGRRGDLDTELVHIHSKRDDSNEDKVVTLTPHRSTMASCMSLNPMGLPEDERRWRQTGKPVDRVRVKKDESPATLELHVRLPTPAAPYAHLSHRLASAHHTALALTTVFHATTCIIPYHLATTASSDTHVIITPPSGHSDLAPSSHLRCTTLADLDIVIITTPRDSHPSTESPLSSMPKMHEHVLPLALRAETATLIARVAEARTPYSAAAEYSHSCVYLYPATAADCASALVARADTTLVRSHSAIVRDDKGVYLRPVYTPVSELLLHALTETCDDDFWTFDHRHISCTALVTSSTLSPITTDIHDIDVQAAVRDTYIADTSMIVADVQTHVYHTHVLTRTRAPLDDSRDRHVDRASTTDTLTQSYAPSILSTAALYTDLSHYDDPLAVRSITLPCLITAYLHVETTLLDLALDANCAPDWDPHVIYQDLTKTAAMRASYARTQQEWSDSIHPQHSIDCVTHSHQMLAMRAVGVWSASLTAESSSRETIADGQTRVFTGAPIDVSSAGKVLVDNLTNYLYSQHLTAPRSVGIHTFTRACDRLATTSDHTCTSIDCDASRSDSSLSPVLSHSLCHLRERSGTSDKRDTRASRHLYPHIVYTPLLTIDAYIVKKHKRNNSGQPPPVVDNTLLSMIVVDYCRSVITNTTALDMTFTYMCNADDLIIHAPHDEISVIHERSATSSTDRGLTYNLTDVHDSIDEVHYMSHTSMTQDAIYIPTLCRERLVALLECESSDESSRPRSALNAAFIDSSGYPDSQHDITQSATLCAHTHAIQYPLLSDDRVETSYMHDTLSLAELDMEALMPDIFTFAHIELHALDLAATDADIHTSRDECDATTPSVPSSPSAAQTLQTPSADTVTELSTEIDDARETPTTRPCAEPTDAEQDPDAEHDATDTRQTVTTPDTKHISKRAGPSKPLVTSDDVHTIPTHALQSTTDLKPARVSRTAFTCIPRSHRDTLTPEVVTNSLAYVPPSQPIDTQMPPASHVDSWAIRPADAHALTIQSSHETLLPACIVTCIITATRDERQSESTWRAVELNTTAEDVHDMQYPMDPIFKHALPTMSTIMRHLSDHALLMYQTSVQHGHASTVTPARTAAYTRVDDLWLAIDSMPESQLSRHQLTITHQISAANVRRADTRLSALSAPAEHGRVHTERHTTTDVSAHSHSHSAAALT
uniref:Polyprotein n=1 Tax=Squash vein yellowing virus TaxID=397544 RepID=A0A1D9CFE4_9POTY|nr:polyprotein [Squash vein yellowing virus]